MKKLILATLAVCALSLAACSSSSTSSSSSSATGSPGNSGMSTTTIVILNSQDAVAAYTKANTAYGNHLSVYNINYERPVTQAQIDQLIADNNASIVALHQMAAAPEASAACKNDVANSLPFFQRTLHNKLGTLVGKKWSDAYALLPIAPDKVPYLDTLLADCAGPSV